MNDLLVEAERLEKEAASSRVAYFGRLAPARPGQAVLDLGCGSGYSVREWRSAGARAVGLDRSFYRASKWAAEGAPAWFVIGDATRLPFRDRSFDLIVSSGMIEHVGVVESSTPYSVTALQDRDLLRARALGEAIRSMGPEGRAFFDFPNALFPVDFWHGDSVGSFRIHGPSDALLPSAGRFQQWVSEAGGASRLCPLRDRLKMRQVSKRWWGRLLRAPMAIHLAVLDFLVARGLEFFGRFFAPYLVLEVRPKAYRSDLPVSLDGMTKGT